MIRLLFFLAFLFNSAAADCPIGWQLSLYSTYCYKAFLQPQNWYFAEQYCASLASGGHLVSVPNAFSNSYAASLVEEALPNATEWWLGGSTALNPGVWTWSDQSKFGYTNWATGQSCNNPNDCCLTQHDQNGQWYIHACLQSYPFVCEIPSKTY